MVEAYTYETSPRKLRPEYMPEITTKKKTRAKAKPKTKAKAKAKTHASAIIYTFIGFLMLFTISYRNSLINETYNKMETAKSSLSAIQKENEQLKINIENSLNLSNIEKEASDQLGMRSISNAQKVYINVEKEDYIETSKNEVNINKEESWFDKIIKTLTQNIK